MPAAKAKDARSELFRQATARLVDDFQSRRPLRAGSLLVSVFGDAIAPRGGGVWLGSLINVLEPFGINQRLVRTSVFRLAKEGWLESQQVGRRSYYSLTPQGRGRFQAASKRIYSEPQLDWQGNWCLVLLAGVDARHRDAIRKELVWSGFAPFSANVLAHPSPDSQAVEERLHGLPGNEKLLVMQARANSNRQAYLRELVHDSWSLSSLSDQYAEFLDRFRPVYQAARRSTSLDPEIAFRVRTLLIHEYRKVLLRDPFLPDDMLPDRWHGAAAYQLCRNLYNRVASATEDFLSIGMETADGPLPPADTSFLQRFGGLDE